MTRARSAGRCSSPFLCSSCTYLMRERESMESLVSNRHSVKAHPFFPNDQGDPSKKTMFSTRKKLKLGTLR